MKDWLYKERDLIIAKAIIAQMAIINDGGLRFLEDYREDKKTNTFAFRLPVWVAALVNAFREFYNPDELIEIMGKVLDEVLKQLNCLKQEDAALFKNIVTFALSKNLPSKVIH